MKVKCRVSIGNRRGGIKKIIEIDDSEVEGLPEDEMIDVIERHFNRWLQRVIHAEWEIENR
ncbi:MAG TPA: hypothetical protein VF260_06285 [Bacilli bacterium]